ncbi:MAG: translation initiation factor Sui1 [Desulfosalsimonas sp.]
MSRQKDSNSRVVYSTEHGRMCPDCNKPAAECRCGQKSKPPHGDGKVRVYRETKGRKGKGVTVISGLAMDEDAIKQLARRLKTRCGSGGTVKNGVIEIQGDRREKAAEELAKEGFNVD